jgi:Ca2+-binding RTX toxin-like protein
MPVSTTVRGGVLPAHRRTPRARAATAIAVLVPVVVGAVLVRTAGDEPGPDTGGDVAGDVAGDVPGDVEGGAAPRVLRGTRGPDRLVLDDLGPTAAGDRARGGAGSDFVTAYPAAYVDGPPTPVALLSGGRGDDAVTGYARVLRGGRGDDILRTYELREPVVSTVRCGAGVDTLTMDRQLDGPLDDFGGGCEEVRVWIWSSVRGNQVVTGTAYDDRIRTLSDSIGGGDDIIRSGRGDDRVQGDWGSDLAYLGPGDDYYADVTTHASGDVDRIFCGPGRDTVSAFRADRVADDCEVVEYWD